MQPTRPVRKYVGLSTRPCEHCGTKVTRKDSAFREHVFCSTACYHQSAYNFERLRIRNERDYTGRRITKPCEQCGTVVERAVSQFAGRTYCSRQCKRDAAVARAHRQVNSNGYAVVYVGKGARGANAQGQILEHRKVMQDYLGRALTPDENVHHKNGDRSDNRIANLELWTKSQPSGQRVVDKIAWARELLALYEGVDIE